MNFKAPALRRLEAAGSPSRLFVMRHGGAGRARLPATVKATFMPGEWAWNTEGSGSGGLPLHGVLHSTKLPAELAEVVDMYDARDAIEACGGLWGDERETCFAVFGVAPDAELWYGIVSKLEAALDMDTQPEEDALHRGQERC